jgi:hypothetical protein
MPTRSERDRTHHGQTPWAALLVLALLAALVFGAWRLGVIVGSGADWHPPLPRWSALKDVPKPPAAPTQRRPAVQPG